MSSEKALALVAEIALAPSHEVPGSKLVPPMILQSRVAQPATYDDSSIERALRVHLPPELIEFWSAASEIRLHEDVNYGQWGCILWSPAEIVARHTKAFGWRGPDDFRPGDLIFGEFRGDCDLVVLRCDPSAKDFGRIVIALAMDPRSEWPEVAGSIAEFVRTFLAHPDQKYWEILH